MDCELKLIWNSSKTFLNERVLRSCLPPLGGDLPSQLLCSAEGDVAGITLGSPRERYERKSREKWANRSKDGKLNHQDMEGLCFPLSAFGPFMATEFCPNIQTPGKNTIHNESTLCFLKKPPKIDIIGFIFGAGPGRSWFGKASIAWRRRGCNYGGSTVWPHTKTRVSRLHCRDIIHSHTKTHVSLLNCIVSFRALHRVYFKTVTWIVLYSVYAILKGHNTQRLSTLHIISRWLMYNSEFWSEKKLTATCL